MLFIEIEKLQFPGSHIKIKLIREYQKRRIRLPGGHIEIMLVVEVENKNSSATILKTCYT